MSNVYIRSIYAPGFSFITLSFFKTNLSISFTPWLSKDATGRSQYDTKKYVSTTINDENAATLYLLSKQITDGTLSNPVQYVIQCNKQAKLVFEYKPDPNTGMKAYLTIEKGKDKILFEFPTSQYKAKENDQIVVKNIQSGLLVFTEALQAYLTAVGADRQRSNPSAQGFGTPQVSTSEWM